MQSIEYLVECISAPAFICDGAYTLLSCNDSARDLFDLKMETNIFSQGFLSRERAVSIKEKIELLVHTLDDNNEIYSEKVLKNFSLEGRILRCNPEKIVFLFVLRCTGLNCQSYEN